MVRLHRWLGIVLCIVVALWFLTGSVLSFVPFPLLDRQHRLAGSSDIDLGRVTVAPTVAMAIAAAPEAQPVRAVRLISSDGQPRYIVVRADGGVAAVSAITGQLLPLMDRTGATRVARTFSGDEIMRIAGPFELDQWTVHGGYWAARPYYRVRLADAAGTDVYVSARSGEVAQRTRRAERAWNYVGAVVHWINPVVLRRDYVLWRRVVWTLALGGMVLALAGLWLGVWRWWQWRRLRRPGFTPFRGLRRWHHALGLGAGILLLSWVTSGWLSLDNGWLFSTGEVPVARQRDYRGITLEAAAAAFPIDALRQASSARELQFTAVGGQPLLVARGSTEADVRVLQVGGSGTPQSAATVAEPQLTAAVAAAFAPARVVSQSAVASDDAYSLRIAPLPPHTRRFVLDDAHASWVQVDADSGDIVSVLDRSARVRRWLVEGLHTFDFPWLNRAGPLWHVLLLLGTAAGFVLSVSGAVLGWRRLRR